MQILKRSAALLLLAGLAWAQKTATPVSSSYGLPANQLNAAPYVQVNAGLPTSLNCSVAGVDLAFDSTNLVLYVCATTGTPGVWKEIGKPELFTVGTGGVTINTLVQTDASAPTKIVAATTGVYGIALATVSSGGTVWVMRWGTALCVADTGGLTAGNMAVIGTGTVVDCKDSGVTSSSSLPLTTRIAGLILTSASAGATATIELTPSHFGSQQYARTCDIAIGDTSGSAITNAQLGPQSRICYIPYASTILEMDVNADGGTPNAIVGRNHAGTVTNIVSSALATAASGGIACSNTGGTTGLNGATTCSSTLQNTSLAMGDYLELVSGTAGGTAKFVAVHVIYR